MHLNKKVAVVVPCYNEESQVARVVETMPGFVDTVVVVNDKSSDRTSEVIRHLAEKNDRIVFIDHEVNQGVGASIASGYKYCRDNDIDVAAVMAGDGQMNPNDLINIIAPVAAGEVDYSKGNRLIVSDSYKKIPRLRFFGNQVLSFLTKIASGYWHISDSQSGYTAINKKALHVIDWDKMYKRYGQPNDLLVKLNVYNFKVRDIPNEPVYHVGEQSKMKIKKVVFTVSWLLIKLFFYRMKEKYVVRDFHPLVLFYGFGFFQLLLFLIAVARIIAIYSTKNYVPDITLVIGLFCVSTGLQSLLFGMLFDMTANRDLK